MCGILFVRSPQLPSMNCTKALESMDHRGPDATGSYLHGNNYFGHKRLKVLDLTDFSNQPFFDEGKKYVLLFNGEIYNFKELAAKYKIFLHSSSDTELLLKLYILIGEKMLNELNGMFALIIYHLETNELFVARDRLGVKPLFFYSKSDELIFSSEIAAIQSLKRDVEIDDMGVRQYKKLRGFYNGRTLYKNISQFPAAHFWKNGKVVPYWDLEFVPKDPPSDEELFTLLDSAIKSRLIADVPVGSFLSGGLDSSIVACSAGKPDTWTVGFKDNNEFQYSRLVSNKIQSCHHEILIDKAEFIETAQFMIRKRKEPLCVPNEVLLFKMSKEVKKKNTVVLCGEGADEAFFGYDRIFRWASSNKWNLESFDKLYSYGKHEDYEVIEEVLTPFTSRYSKSIDIVASFFQLAHLSNLLKRLDHSTMLASVEAREPFVDYRIIERMSGVDFSYKMNRGIVKAPLKRVYKSMLPPQVIEREKVGFPVNLDDVFSVRDKTFDAQSGFDKWIDFNLNVLLNN